MAAGLGTRFGGLKQLYPLIDDFSIIDFSIYDAYCAGFNKIILIIREQTQALFEEHFSRLDTSLIQISYIHQSFELPVNYNDKIIRQKPWGTGHALLELEGHVSSNFALINADDFYGKDAFKLMHDNLYNNRSDCNYLIGYNITNTLSTNGSVSRGECIIDNNNNLKHIIERHNIRFKNNELIYGENNPISNETTVSMNFWGFTTSIFNTGKEAFNDFLKEATNFVSDEFYITTIVDKAIDQHQHFKVLNNNAQWHGITYKKDEEAIKHYLESLIETNHYRKRLCNHKINSF